MKVTRMEKGITLIALLITIVVLIILAAVTISTLGSDEEGLIIKAQDIADRYEEAQTNELSRLDSYVDYMDEQYANIENNGGTAETGTKLGKYVTYKGITWRVLKDDSSSVELLSDNSVSSKEIGDMSNPIDYYNYVGEFLDTACGAYVANGEAISFSVRSVTGADLDTMTSNGMLVSANATEYWINEKSKSRSYGDSNSDGVDEWFDGCRLHYVTSEGTIGFATLFTQHELGGTMGPVNVYTKPIRPVIILSAGVLDNVTGSGTVGQPYVLN